MLYVRIVYIYIHIILYYYTILHYMNIYCIVLCYYKLFLAIPVLLLLFGIFGMFIVDIVTRLIAMILL